MAIGDVTKVQFETLSDPDTKAPVTWVTDDVWGSIYPHFRQTNLPDDSNGLLVSGKLVAVSAAACAQQQGTEQGGSGSCWTS